MKNIPTKIKYLDNHQITKFYVMVFVLLLLILCLFAYIGWMHNQITSDNVYVHTNRTEKYLNFLIIGFGLLMGFSLILIYSIFNAYVGDHKTRLKKVIDKFKCKFDKKVEQSTKSLDEKTEDVDSAIWEQFDLFIIVNPHMDYLTKMSSIMKFLNKKHKGIEIEVSIRSALIDYYDSLSKSGKKKPFGGRLDELIEGW